MLYQFEPTLALVETEPAFVDRVAGAFSDPRGTRSVRRILGIADLLVEAGFPEESLFLGYMSEAGEIQGVKSLKFSHFVRVYKGQYIIPHGWSERTVVRSWERDDRMVVPEDSQAPRAPRDSASPESSDRPLGRDDVTAMRAPHRATTAALSRSGRQPPSAPGGPHSGITSLVSTVSGPATVTNSPCSHWYGALRP